MEKWVCYICKKNFKRYRSQVRDCKNVCCSKKCSHIKYQESLKGKNNPNYRNGNYCEERICCCGKIKDFRAEKCIECRLVKLDRQEIINIVKTTNSFLELATALKTSRTSITRLIKKFKIDISHFRPGRNRPLPDNIIFIENSEYTHGMVRNRILVQNLIPYKCSECNLENKWNNKILTLELDHKNGNRYDNRLENLRFLCPNCHTQQPTSRGKNHHAYK